MTVSAKRPTQEKGKPQLKKGVDAAKCPVPFTMTINAQNLSDQHRGNKRSGAMAWCSAPEHKPHAALRVTKVGLGRGGGDMLRPRGQVLVLMPSERYLPT